jgi:hypothetical protein
MPAKGRIADLRLMLRGMFALLSKRVSVQRLVDADIDFESSRNPFYANEAREKQRREHKPVLIDRLRALRKGLLFSFIFMLSAVILGFLLIALGCRLSSHDKAWLGGASMFSFAWSTLARLSKPKTSLGGDSVIERLDTRIFWFLYWVGTLFGTLALI